MQLDEKWSFVAKKDKRCDPAEPADVFAGSAWDHVALDTESRLVLEVVVGPRTLDMAVLLLEGVRDRLGGRAPELICADEHPAYPEAVLSVFGEVRVPPRAGKPGRPAGPRVVPPEGLCFATVHKVRQGQRGTAVEARVVLGALAEGEGASTAYVERHNATDRHRNARKGRKTYRFSKDWEVHEAMTWYTNFSYNFCWPVRTLAVDKDERGRWHKRTAAMAAGLTDHIWTLREWLTLPGVQR